MVDPTERFQWGSQLGFSEPDYASRDDENHTAGVRRALWIARDAQDARVRDLRS
jgi:hypothetical protein